MLNFGAKRTAFLRMAGSMFSVERIIGEEAIVDTMETMRTWLDHKHYEPTTFRYSFTGAGVVFRVDFMHERAAADFAAAFQGRLVPPLTETAI